MLTPPEIRQALLATGESQQELFAEARRLRDEHFGPQVVLRGVVEITNVCRVNCEYCPMRKDNTRENDRFFMSSEAILSCVNSIREAGIDIILLQGGETPRSLVAVKEAIPAIRELYDGKVEILLNLGNFSRQQYEELRELGATSYILKHETSDPELHMRLRHESLDERLRCMKDLLALGYKVGTGLISGLPDQSLDSIVDDVLLAGDLGVHMCSVSPFVPAPNTPMSVLPAAPVGMALNIMAVLRICYPHLLIPSVSALEKNEEGGQSSGLGAGANVLTVNFTNEADRDRYLIYGSKRYVVGLQHVKDIVHRAGLSTRGSVFI
ncbi:radical SAM protein [Kitasatospora sp. RB6PN24]|uniref:biotin synthase BioB n=1 Tax=Kitasatospora humi TaxID=2893891 RepID=UPI001E5F4619|nr:radical SAM protein [Kitasatospora humi]MCC9312337.1 radical SAM protein [Kitasatospora humi]